MKVKVERLRVGLVAGTLLLLVVLAGTLGYSRYRAGKAWFQKVKDHSGASVVRETDGFTYSQSMQGRTLFTLHAAKAFQHEGGVWTLNNVVITVYGAHDGMADRIYGNEFEWDETKGIARALGDTQMDLQVPAATATGQRASAVPVDGARSPGSVHVKTSGLVFLRKLGVAATTNDVEIRYGSMVCTARGAELDNNPSELHLLADVHASGILRGEPVTLTAIKADFARDTNVATLLKPVVVSGDRRGRAADAVLHMRHDGSLEHVDGRGGVVLDSGKRHLTAPQMEIAFNERSQVQIAHLSGGVKMGDDDDQRPARGEAGEVRAHFDALGRPEEVVATNVAHVLVRQASGNGAWLERELRGDKVQAAFSVQGKAQAQLQQVHATGAAFFRGESLAANAGTHVRELKSTGVAADDIVTGFVPTGGKDVRPDRTQARGHAVLQQKGASGEERTSTADALDILFAAPDGSVPGRVEVASAIEDGHVRIRSRTPAKAGAKSKQDEVATASAGYAAYNGASERLTLSGGVHVADAATAITADSVVVEQVSGDAEARGNVTATLASANAGDTGPQGPGATHVVAQHGVLHHQSQVAEFDGSDGRPARMWQEASQVEAAKIVLDGRKHTLLAQPGSPTGTVHSIFAGVQPVKRAEGTRTVSGGLVGAGTSNANVLRVESGQMEYSDASREAVFAGPITMQGALGEVRARRAVATFAPAAPVKRDESATTLPVGGLERVVASGDVRMTQPGRQGTGDVLTYKAADNSFVLTGAPGIPPRIEDAQQGRVTGTSLLFRPGDSTIVVSGGAAGETKRSRARIDTKVRQ